MNNYRTMIFGGIAVLALIGPAFGHAALQNSNPADGTSVEPPKTISLTFNEKLTPAFSGFDLVMPTMSNMKVGVAISVSDDGKSITGTPKRALSAGLYQVNWHAVTADDGHRTEGKISFTVK